MNMILANKRADALAWWRSLSETEQRELAKKHKSWWDFNAVTRSTSTIVQIYQEEQHGR